MGKKINPHTFGRGIKPHPKNYMNFGNPTTRAVRYSKGVGIKIILGAMLGLSLMVFFAWTFLGKGIFEALAQANVFSQTKEATCQEYGCENSITFECQQNECTPASDATLSLTLKGDYNFPTEKVEISLDGKNLDKLGGEEKFTECENEYTKSYTIKKEEVAKYFSDQRLEIKFKDSDFVDCCCPAQRKVKLEFQYAGPTPPPGGTPTPPGAGPTPPPSSPPEGQCHKFVDNGPASTKLDFIFIGDSYSQGATLRKHAERVYSVLMAMPPFKANACKFNFYLVSGNFDFNGKTLIKTNFSLARKTATGACKVWAEEVHLLVNMTKTAGVVGVNFGGNLGSGMSVVPGPIADGISYHEFGHTFGLPDHSRPPGIPGTKCRHCSMCYDGGRAYGTTCQPRPCMTIVEEGLARFPACGTPPPPGPGEEPPSPPPVDDKTPPKIDISSPPPGAEIHETNPRLTILTHEPAYCKFDTQDKSFDQMVNEFETNFERTWHGKEVGPLAEGEHTYFARCQDDFFNTNTSSVKISFIVKPGPDTTPPKISDPKPTGIIQEDYPRLSLKTNETAECKFDEIDADFDQMKYSFISTDGRLIHYKSAIAKPGLNTFYVRCKDDAGNKNTTSATIEFTYEPR